MIERREITCTIIVQVSPPFSDFIENDKVFAFFSEVIFIGKVIILWLNSYLSVEGFCETL
jgi:hypothetical protein